MLFVPGTGPLLVEDNVGSVGTLTPGTAVTTGGASSTKGTPAELIASTLFDAYWVRIMASNYGESGVAADGAMDILIGASTEDVLIPNLLMGYCGDLEVSCRAPKIWDFPLYIPAGSRIACQAAGLRLSTAVRVGIYLFGGNGMPGYPVGTRVTTYGMGTVPNGTAITPGTSGAEGSWTQITASTTEQHLAVVPSFQVTNDSSMNLRGYSLDIGIGSATEEVIGTGYTYWGDTADQMGGPCQSFPTFHPIPSGTRLVARVSNNGTNDAGYDCVLHGVS
ncbi:MAG: hypothetical protein M3N43_05300 [Actinomycetota bacterium]|nr:hypothetical protein [Actinomycetota bacterium]